MERTWSRADESDPESLHRSQSTVSHAVSMKIDVPRSSSKQNDQLQVSMVYEKGQRKDRCGLCKMYYRKGSVTFKVSNHRVIEQLKKWNYRLEGRRYSNASFLYRVVDVCKFCSQFFCATTEFAEEHHKITQNDLEIAETESKLNIETEIERSDIAASQRAYQSSVVDKKTAVHALQPPYEKDSRTRREVDPWWEVDLGRPYHIHSLSFKIATGIHQKLQISIVLLDRPFGFENPFLDTIVGQAILSKEIVIPDQDASHFEDVQWSLPANTVCVAVRIQLRGILSLVVKEFKALQGDNLVPIRREDNELTTHSFASLDPQSVRVGLESMMSLEEKKMRVMENYCGDDKKKVVYLDDAVSGLNARIQSRYEAMDIWKARVIEKASLFSAEELQAIYSVIFKPVADLDWRNKEMHVDEDDLLSPALLIAHIPRVEFNELHQRIRSISRWIQTRSHIKLLGPLLASENFAAIANDPSEHVYKLLSAFNRVEYVIGKREEMEERHHRALHSDNKRRASTAHNDEDSYGGLMKRASADEKRGCSWSQFVIIMNLFCTQQTHLIPLLAYQIEEERANVPVNQLIDDNGSIPFSYNSLEGKSVSTFSIMSRQTSTRFGGAAGAGGLGIMMMGAAAGGISRVPSKAYSVGAGGGSRIQTPLNRNSSSSHSNFNFNLNASSAAGGAGGGLNCGSFGVQFSFSQELGLGGQHSGSRLLTGTAASTASRRQPSVEELNEIAETQRSLLDRVRGEDYYVVHNSSFAEYKFEHFQRRTARTNTDFPKDLDLGFARSLIPTRAPTANRRGELYDKEGVISSAPPSYSSADPREEEDDGGEGTGGRRINVGRLKKNRRGAGAAFGDASGGGDMTARTANSDTRSMLSFTGSLLEGPAGAMGGGSMTGGGQQQHHHHLQQQQQHGGSPGAERRASKLGLAKSLPRLESARSAASKGAGNDLLPSPAKTLTFVEEESSKQHSRKMGGRNNKALGRSARLQNPADASFHVASDPIAAAAAAWTTSALGSSKSGIFKSGKSFSSASLRRMDTFDGNWGIDQSVEEIDMGGGSSYAGAGAALTARTSSTHAPPHLEVNNFVRYCAMCELKFPKESMALKVLRKHVINLKTQIDPKLVSEKVRLLENSISMYSLIEVCAFCSQFFDPDLPEGICAPSREKDDEAKDVASSRGKKSKKARNTVSPQRSVGGSPLPHISSAGSSPIPHSHSQSHSLSRSHGTRPHTLHKGSPQKQPLHSTGAAQGGRVGGTAGEDVEGVGGLDTVSEGSVAPVLHIPRSVIVKDDSTSTRAMLPFYDTRYLDRCGSSTSTSAAANTGGGRGAVKRSKSTSLESISRSEDSPAGGAGVAAAPGVKKGGLLSEGSGTDEGVGDVWDGADAGDQRPIGAQDILNSKELGGESADCLEESGHSFAIDTPTPAGKKWQGDDGRLASVGVGVVGTGQGQGQGIFGNERDVASRARARRITEIARVERAKHQSSTHGIGVGAAMANNS